MDDRGRGTMERNVGGEGSGELVEKSAGMEHALVHTQTEALKAQMEDLQREVRRGEEQLDARVSAALAAASSAEQQRVRALEEVFMPSCESFQ